MTIACRGAQRQAWNHTCAIMAQMAEIHRDPKKRSRPFDPVEMHPMRKKVVARITAAELAKGGGA